MCIVYKHFIKFLVSALFLFSFAAYAAPSINALIHSAESGDMQAQYKLALAYDEGEDIELNREKAVYWYTQAAEQGLAEAQYNLAVSYDEGEGIALNHERAVYWYQKAAEQDYIDAQYNLAVCYYEGEGVEQSYKMALYWYSRGAELGDPSAQYNLGSMYQEGEGTEINIQTAIKWYTKSAEQANSLAQENLAELYFNKTQPDYIQSYAWSSVAVVNGNPDFNDIRGKSLSKLNPEELKQATLLADQYAENYSE